MAAAGITDRITGLPEVDFPIADHPTRIFERTCVRLGCNPIQVEGKLNDINEDERDVVLLGLGSGLPLAYLKKNLIQ
jgi:hypothetical protein